MHSLPTPTTTYDPDTADTAAIRALGLTTPSRTRHIWIGICIATSALLWIGSIGSVVVTLIHDLRSVTAVAVLIAASTATIGTCILATSTTNQRASTANQRTIKRDLDGVTTEQTSIRRDLTELSTDLTMSLATLHATVEQLGAKVSKIDPWTIYTAVAADLLGQESHNGNGGPGGR